MAPNFKLNTVSLLQCSIDLSQELVAPAALNAKNLVAVQPCTSYVPVDSDSYWADSNEAPHDMTVEQMERRQAAIDRVQARIQARKVVNQVSAASIESQLKNDAARRTVAPQVESTDSESYWDMSAPQHVEGRVEIESESYWNTPMKSLDGTVEQLENNRASLSQWGQLNRLANVAAESSSEFSAASVQRLLANEARSGSSLSSAEQYWVC